MDDHPRSYRLLGGEHFIELGSVDMPTPGRGEALVRIDAVSLNYRDLLIARRQSDGTIPCSDAAGTVVALGARTPRVAVGDRVAPIFYQSWLDGPMQDEHLASALGSAVDGVLAEYRTFGAPSLVRLPDFFSAEEAAALPCAGVTAWNAVRFVETGDSVLVLGTGGVSIFALQLAIARGAHAIVLTSSEEKMGIVRQLGATDVINYAADPEWQDAVRDLTGGRGVDHVVEVGGGGTLDRSIAATRRGGRIYLIGVLSHGQIDPTKIMLKSLTLRGIQVGSRSTFESLITFLSGNPVRPQISAAFGFEEAALAYRTLERSSHVGKIVINVSGKGGLN